MQGSKQFSLIYLQDNKTGYLSRNMKWLSRLKKKKLQPSIKRTQFPLVLSWPYTVHKVQGLSLSDGV